LTAVHPFVAASSWEPLGNHSWRGEPAATWLQGKGAFGGILAASYLRAFSSVVADPVRVPKSLTVHFCASTRTQPTTMTARLERVSALVTHVSGRMEQDGQPVTIASATFAAGRTRTLAYQDDVMPTVMPFAETHDAAGNHMFPAFAQHFEYRFCGGHMPFSSANESYMAAWMRVRVPLVVDAVVASALLDAMPPAIFTRMDKRGMAASVDFSMQFYETFPLPDTTADEAYLCTVRSRWAAHGYTEQFNQLWRSDGKLLAQCRQVMAILG